ncbi:MAG TPA: hypothetical protein VEK07_14675 [Polyangiaceae bacterium]|nr:hypothetical protein [Polyangiaceae bacterium]
MSSSSARAHSRVAAAALLVAGTTGSRGAEAQQAAQGFDVDRLYLSAPGAGWFVMDALDMRGGLGGVMALTTGYAHDPLRVRTTDGSQRLTVVSDLALADFGFAATYDRFRLYLNLDWVLDVSGNSGTVGNYQFIAPTTGIPFTPSGVNPSTAPDAFADARIGFDARLLGSAWSPFRLGASAQLLIPSPNTVTSEYVTDGTFRGMLRVLFAGDVGLFGYAGQVGIQIRPLDDAPTPGSPQGSELLFGLAAGPKLQVGTTKPVALIVGPELFGETAFRSFFGSATGVEALVSGRVEGGADDGAQIRVKLGVGGGLDARFGTPEWRAVVGIEVFDHHSDRDRDGVSDSQDACPDAPGVKTKDAKTNGCPVSSERPAAK